MYSTIFVIGFLQSTLLGVTHQRHLVATCDSEGWTRHQYDYLKMVNIIESWLVYVNVSLYLTLHSNNIKFTSLQQTAKNLYFSPKSLAKMSQQNFVQKTLVKSIVGSIKCCFLSSEPVLVVQKSWTFKSSPKLSFNLTFLYIRLKKENDGEMINISYKPEIYSKYSTMFYYFGRRDHFLIYLPRIFEMRSQVFLSSESKFHVMFTIMKRTYDLTHFSLINYQRRLIWIMGEEFKLRWSLLPIDCYRNVLYAHVYTTDKMFQLNLVIENIHIDERGVCINHNGQCLYIRVFDGPDNRNKQITSGSKLFREISTTQAIISLSTFQCYLESNMLHDDMSYSVKYIYPIGSICQNV